MRGGLGGEQLLQLLEPGALGGGIGAGRRTVVAASPSPAEGTHPGLQAQAPQQPEKPTRSRRGLVRPVKS